MCDNRIIYLERSADSSTVARRNVPRLKESGRTDNPVPATDRTGACGRDGPRHVRRSNQKISRADGVVKVVEAGGVEPPSEKARNEENYVRIRLMIFDRHP